MRITFHPHAIHDVTCLRVRLLSLRVCLCLVSLPLLFCFFHCLCVLCPAHNLQCRHRRELKPLHSRAIRSIAPWGFTIFSHGMSPSSLDNFDYPEMSAVIFQNESVDVDTEPSYSCDAELDDEFIGRALSSPLFIHEREEPANLVKLITLMRKVCSTFDRNAVCQPRQPTLLDEEYPASVKHAVEQPHDFGSRYFGGVIMSGAIMRF